LTLYRKPTPCTLPEYRTCILVRFTELFRANLP
jgi:hypothetical protein